MSLEYDVSYHLNCQLNLDSGRQITLINLEQCMTYLGLLEGVPDKEANDCGIECDVKRARERHKLEPYVIPPRRRDYLRTPAELRYEEGSGRAEWMPCVTCTALFRSIHPARDKAMDMSYLAVIWYQDQYCFPIDDAVLLQLRAIDWDSRQLTMSVEEVAE